MQQLPLDFFLSVPAQLRGRKCHGTCRLRVRGGTQRAERTKDEQAADLRA